MPSRRSVIATTATGSVLLLGCAAQGAWAGTFPGTNGDIAWLEAGQTGFVNKLFSATGAANGQLPASVKGPVSVSADGTKIAWTEEDDPDNPQSYAVKVANADGSNVVTVKATGVNNEAPSLSPDGTKVAAADDSFPGSIELLDVAGGATLRLTLAGQQQGRVSSAQISPDGTKVAYIGRPSSSICPDDSIWIVPTVVPNSGPTAGTELGGTCGAGNWGAAGSISWSPDGTKIAFGASGFGATLPFVGVVNADGSSGSATVIETGASAADKPQNPSFSPDGTKIAMVRSDSSGSYVMKVYPWNGSSAGTPTTITNPTGRETGLVTWLPPLTTSGGGTTPSAPVVVIPGTAPVAGSTPDGPASLLRPITTQATKKATRQGATQVAAPVNLRDTGRYTFIFETRANSNERWTEMQTTGAKRVVQLKNSRIGKKTLRRNSTAPVYTTTSANKRLVVVALIKKAQAKNMRLRVIHRAANGTLTQDVFNA